MSTEPSQQDASVSAERPALHALVYGDTGVGKSTFVADCVQAIARRTGVPGLVWNFEPLGKDMPYQRLGPVHVNGVEALTGTPYLDIYSDAGEWLVRLEYFIDAEVTRPDAYARHVQLSAIDAEQARLGVWSSVTLESATFAEFRARKWHEYVLNRAAVGQGRMQWWGGAADLFEEKLQGQLASLPCNVFVTAHIDEEKDEYHGMFVRTAGLPGRAARRKKMMAGFQEIYRVDVVRTSEGRLRYEVQTHKNDLWMATTQIDAPDLCAPRYEALWQAWDGAAKGKGGIP